MGAYLIDNPPSVSQYSPRSNWSKSTPTGLIVLHTSESVMDTLGPDTGAEAVAQFIRGRATYGSYHDLVDSDSVINLVPYELGAYQDGTGSNGFALSLSFACSTSDWRRMSEEKRAGFLRQGAKAFARQQRWLKANDHPTTPLRLLTKAQTDAGMAGLTYHGYRDPGRRSDPGVAPPDLFPFDEFVAACRAELDGTTTTTPQGGLLMALSDEQQQQLFTMTKNIHTALFKKRKRRGVLPTDKVQEATLEQELVYGMGSVLLTRRGVEQLADDLDTGAEPDVDPTAQA